MRLQIKHKVSQEGLLLPVNYHHILQSAIYAKLKDTPYKNLHDGGAVYEKRNIKMFNFSEIQGKYQIADRNILFTDEISYWITSPDKNLLFALLNKIQEQGLTYGQQVYDNVKIFVDTKPITSETVHIRMLSPICLYSTNPETKKNYFYSPEDKEFFTRLQENFLRKYQAFYGEEPKELPEISVKKVNNKHKKVTRYKGTILSGWMGEYTLSGPAELLNFWYEIGLGSRNGQGFGMFQLMKE